MEVGGFGRGFCGEMGILEGIEGDLGLMLGVMEVSGVGFWGEEGVLGLRRPF